MDIEKTFEILKGTLAPDGSTYEIEYSTRFLRDTFPNGVPADLAVKALKEVNRGDDFLETSALIWLAMVPTPGIAGEVLARLNHYRSQENQTKEILSCRYRLAKALCFLGLEEGEKEFNELRKLMETYPKYGQPIPDTYFKEFDEELAQWKKDRAEGKRWEPDE